MLVSISTAAFAQKSGPRSGYNFTTIVDLKTTPVKNQQSVGTCWDYATLSFLETELLRKGKPVYDLAELYVAKNAYFEKGLRYVQFHGKTNFSEGGQAHDVIDMIKKYGIVPEEAYTGLQYGRDFHIHAEMVAALQGILDAVNKNPNRQITPVWTKGFMRYIEAYLGDSPETFTYEGKEYTPQSFAASLDLNLNDYVELTSYQMYPFYEEVELTIPDNWMHARYYNLPIDELMEVMNNALKNGYSVCWDGDVSEQGFSFKNGIAINPQVEDVKDYSTTDRARFEKMPKYQRMDEVFKFEQPYPEINVTPEIRQDGYEKFVTTDDHLMHITGIVKDQNGTKYYITKNSWGAESNKSGGYLNMSESYVRAKTICVMVHKDSLPKELKKKLGIQ